MAVNSMVSARMTTSSISVGSQDQHLRRDSLLIHSDLTSEAANVDDETHRQPTPEMERLWFPSVTDWWMNLNKRSAATVLVLCYCNLINYMDRSTVAGMMENIRKDPHFNIHADKSLGLLQTAFVVFYMITAPLFGYLGDRYSRKWIVGFGLTVWSLATLLGSFCTSFYLFLFLRAVVGIGEASYSTIAPAIISDLFVSDARSKVLALFYFAIPVGTGLGYIVGSEVANAAPDWRWGLRVTPFMGLVAIVLVVFIMKDPPRGMSEGASMRPRSSMEDLKSLWKNKSFCLSTIAFTCVAFCVGALMWWGPNFAFYGAKANCGSKANCEKITQANISYKFGIVMTLAGLIGVPMGSYVAQGLRHKMPNADPIVCGTSLLLSVPVLYFGFIAARHNVAWCYGLTFLAGLLLNCNWAIVSDITLYIVIPIRRSFASATQILVSHAFGDAVSPYLIGAIADAVKNAISRNHNIPVEQENASPVTEHTPEWYEVEFRSLQYALFICCFFQTIGAFVFLVMSWYVLKDKEIATEEARAYVEDNQTDSVITDETMDDENVPVIRNMYADDAGELIAGDDDQQRQNNE